jgi:tetratricopeptide (TPR) repeat protein
MRNNTIKSFADISKFSLYSDEKEVLFFIGTVFRIDSVTEESNSLWIIEMTLNNETDEQIKWFTDDFEKQLTTIVHVQDSFMKTDDFTMAKRYYTMLTTQSFPLNDIPKHMINQILAYFCSNLGNYKKAIELYENLLLGKNFIDKPKCIVLNIIIGYNYFNLSQYKNALDHYEIALSLLDNDNLVTGELYNHIGDTWQRMRDFNAALLSYQEAERILKSYQDNSCLRDIHLKISELYQQQGKANMINQQVRPTTHLNDDERLKHFQNQLSTEQNLSLYKRADLFYNIGLCLIRKGDFSEALNNLSNAETLFKQDPPASDRFVHIFATLYENFALVYLRLHQFLKALIMWRKAIDIRANIPWN